MRTFIKIIMLLATLLLAGFNTLQCTGISSFVGVATDASNKQALLVAGLQTDLDAMIAARGLVRRFEPPSPLAPPSAEGQMVLADREGVMDRTATALEDRVRRERLISTASTVGSTVGGVIALVLSGGMLCISTAVWLGIMLIGFAVLSLIKPRAAGRMA